MTAENKSFQGNLFIDSEEDFLEVASLQKSTNQNNLDLDEEKLSKDGLLRPRKKNVFRKSEGINKSKNKPDSEKELLSWTHHTMVNKLELTPVLRHYVELKSQNPERVLLYRLGDFFECFFEDAIYLSEVLELTLTGKEGGKTIGRVPMAGIPHHAAERYCSTLIQKGSSVAICDQLESVQNKEGKLLKRGITRILTPGTILEEGMLQAKKNNWLGALVIEKTNQNDYSKWSLAKADISTGEFIISVGNEISSLEQDLLNSEAAEIICEELDSDIFLKLNANNINFNLRSKTSFNVLEAETQIKKYYKLKTIQGFGLNESKLALRTAGGLLAYLNETNPQENINNNSKVLLEFPRIYLPNNSLIIDSQTRRNLEITRTQRDGQFQGSLLWSIDRTLTAMGGRCLRSWLDKPLITTDKIISRQDIISMLVEKKDIRKILRSLLRTMGDLERLAGRASAGQAGGRDLIAIADGLRRLPRLSINLKELKINFPDWLSELVNINTELTDLAKNIKDQLIENPPLNITEGGLIYDGVDPMLDGLRNQLDDQNKWLSQQELKERKISKNNNLKLQHHRNFGYFLSVKKSKSNSVPSHWIRRQTLANEERFVTPDLKEREGKIFKLKSKLENREYELFCNLRSIVASFSQSIRNTAKAVAALDVLLGLAELAATNNYCAPEILDNKNNNFKGKLNIKACRHPVVEQILVEEEFQANDIYLDNNTNLIILTGPNASGKSCYLRQIGLIQLLAQIGSWIPAKQATLTIADRIFTRVGAVDDLSAGQSTFMVEMAETAFILNQATNNSIVLLDEIGRGTSTFDGLSIAWAVSEFLAEKVKSKTIFATHYHELNDLAKKMKNVANFQVLVEETKEELYFLHKVIPGGASKSYGIEAARLAGVPLRVIDRARTILSSLETR